MVMVMSVTGSAETWVRNLGTTDDVIIATGSEARGFRLESLLASTDGTATTFFLWVYDGTNSVYIVNGDTIAANKSLEVTHPITLKPGWSLRCKAGVGGHIGVTATLALLGKQTA